MKKKYGPIIVIAFFYSIGILQAQNKMDDFPVLKAPHLGQNPPGMTPEIFASGIISTGHEEFKAVFTPDGNELYYHLWGAPFLVILMMKEENGIWTKPEVAPFSGHIIEEYTKLKISNIFSPLLPNLMFRG